MAKILSLSPIEAGANKFMKVKMENFPFSIMADFGNITGSPTYKLLVCNFDGEEADFVELSDVTNNLAINTPVKWSQFPFEYLGVKYTANGASGTLQFYVSQ